MDNLSVLEWLKNCEVSSAIVEVDEVFYLISPSSIKPISNDGSLNLHDLQRFKAPLWLVDLIREVSHRISLVEKRHQNNLQAFERLLWTEPVVRHIYELHGRQVGEELYLDIVVALVAENRRLQKLALDSMSRMPPPAIGSAYFAGGSEAPSWLQGRGENE